MMPSPPPPPPAPYFKRFSAQCVGMVIPATKTSAEAHVTIWAHLNTAPGSKGQWETEIVCYSANKARQMTVGGVAQGMSVWFPFPGGNIGVLIFPVGAAKPTTPPAPAPAAPALTGPMNYQITGQVFGQPNQLASGIFP